MPYLYLTLSVFMNASSSIFGKLFHSKNDGMRDRGTFYNFLLMISVFLGWGILFLFDASFDVGVLWYAVLFSLCYIVYHIGIINGLKYGPTTLTSLLISLSTILTAIWGFIFWDAPITVPMVSGLVLVVVAIALCLASGQRQERMISWRWLFYVLLGFLGSAGCSIVQRTQQISDNGQHGYMLMLFASGCSVLVYAFFYWRSDKTDTKPMLKGSWWLPVCAGLCNVGLNVFVMLMAMTDLSPGLIYPVIGVGRLALIAIFSLAVFRERMRWWQWIGVAVGAAAVLLLSL